MSRTFGRVCVIDSHTGGEPTRVVISGGPDLGTGSLAERLERFRAEHDTFRSAVVNEPRGSDVLVGALLVTPTDAAAAAGVIFFNNVGYLGMCGHGTIGLVVTLAHLGRLQVGDHRIETPVGAVTATRHSDDSVSVTNVASFRKAKAVTADVPGIGPVTGDVAWGGNWFFLVDRHEQSLNLTNVDRLTDFSWRVRQAINAAGFPEVDHVELFSPSPRPGVNARNFVLCPGKAYDRSPCGTGTSAKLACLHADGKLSEGDVWRQESIIGSIFEGTVRVENGQVIPRVRGTAHITAEATLILDPADPFQTGIPRQAPLVGNP